MSTLIIIDLMTLVLISVLIKIDLMTLVLMSVLIKIDYHICNCFKSLRCIIAKTYRF